MMRQAVKQFGDNLHHSRLWYQKWRCTHFISLLWNVEMPFCLAHWIYGLIQNQLPSLSGNRTAHWIEFGTFMPDQYCSGPRNGKSCEKGEPSHFACLSRSVAPRKNHTRRVWQLGDFSLAWWPWHCTRGSVQLLNPISVTNVKTRTH